VDFIGLGQDREMGIVGGNITLNRPRHIWDDIIGIDLQEKGCGRMDCFGVGQDREMGNLRKETIEQSQALIG